MFALGDTVVYRHHVCTVAALRENYFENKDYWELRTLFDGSLKLFVSVEEAEYPALRKVMTKDEAIVLIDSIADADTIDEENLRRDAGTPTLLERKVKEEYERHLKTFAPEELVPIMKSVHERTVRREKQGRRITATDKKYFELAENVLFDELSVSLDMPRDEVRDYVVARVERCERNR